MGLSLLSEGGGTVLPLGVGFGDGGGSGEEGGGEAVGDGGCVGNVPLRRFLDVPGTRYLVYVPFFFS